MVSMDANNVILEAFGTRMTCKQEDFIARRASTIKVRLIRFPHSDISHELFYMSRLSYYYNILPCILGIYFCLRISENVTYGRNIETVPSTYSSIAMYNNIT